MQLGSSGETSLCPLCLRKSAHCSKEQKKADWIGEPRSGKSGETGGSCFIMFRQAFMRKLPVAKSEALALLLTYHPDFFVCGHTHAYPYLVGKRWAQKIRGVNVLVPGQLLRAPCPNHIVLDTESGRARWQTSSRVWIPEDGFYYHLLLKVT